ncbi:ATP-binding cassette domain-containing protein [Streptosporangium sp. CA-135522]|uniref:ATP-binding cassette domain-containing protein n=1 Tax=Streptosporangium sp. CA-135522 TaxID=3240072 RepID=UPI003D9057A3
MAFEPIQPEHHHLEFDSVTFQHGDRTVIDDVSSSVPEGQRLAVVGPPGAGKSTLLQLLARFYDVDAGLPLPGLAHGPPGDKSAHPP